MISKYRSWLAEMYFSSLCRGGLIICLSLAANPSFAEPRIFLVIGESRDGQVGGALSATLAQFCGPSRCGEIEELADAPAGKNGQDDLFGLDDALPWHRSCSRRVGLGLQVDQNVSKSMAAIFAVSATLAQSRYAFPQGLTQVLSEPGTVAFNALEIDPSVGLEWREPVPGSDRFTTRTRVATGYEIAFIQTRIDNPVLRVRNTATMHSHFLEVSAALNMAPSHHGAIGMEAAIAARGYSGERLTVTSELRFRR